MAKSVVKFDRTYYVEVFEQQKTEVLRRFAIMKHEYPKAVAELDACERIVSDFCGLNPSMDMDGLVELSKKQTTVVAALSATDSVLRRRKLWGDL